MSRVWGISHMRISPDALICICERLICRRINDRSSCFFYQHAIRRLSIINHRGARGKRGIIKCVPRIRILGHLNVFARLFESLEIGSTRTDLNIIVRYSVKDPYWMVCDVSIADESRIALRIERNMGRWIDPTWVPHLMESLERRI